MFWDTSHWRPQVRLSHKNQNGLSDAAGLPCAMLFGDLLSTEYAYGVQRRMPDIASISSNVSLCEEECMQMSVIISLSA
jgi:hypothetical protein